MTKEFYGKDLARYKLDRALEELDTAELLFENDKLKAANNRAYYSIYYAITWESSPERWEETYRKRPKYGMPVIMMNFTLPAGKKPNGKLKLRKT